MAIFTIDTVSRYEKGSSIDSHNIKRVPVGKNWCLNFDKHLTTSVNIKHWTFIWYGEYKTLPDFQRVVDLLDSGHVGELWGNRGILIALNRDENSVYLINDCYGSFPVYFSEGGAATNLIASNSLADFHGKGIDWASFYQFLSLGYVFGEYSLFRNVWRLRANSCLTVQFRNDNFSVSRQSLKNFWSPKQEKLDQKKDDLIDILREESNGFENVQVMMSGGWDSRLVLSVLEHKKPTLFTHGNLESREVEIVRDIAKVCDLNLIERSLSDIKFDAELFSGYLFNNDSAMFTHWSAAGAHAELKNLLMTAGTFGEVLGGHYGTLNSLPGKKKYASLLMHVLGFGVFFDNLLGLYSPEVVINYLKMSDYRVFWLLNNDIEESLRSKNLIDESNDRLKGIFESYREQGMEDAQTMFERFYTEHRGGQYINLQLTNSARKYFYRNIFTNRDLVETVSSIPFSYRAHNKLNKIIIKQLHPRLLAYPMAATLSNASRPLLIQEGSRALRKVIERKPQIYSLYKSISRYGDRSFGWNNFRGIVNDDLIMEVSPLLSGGLWDRDKILQVVGSEEASNMYPLFDMLSKAITLNYFYSTS